MGNIQCFLLHIKKQWNYSLPNPLRDNFWIFLQFFIRNMRLWSSTLEGGVVMHKKSDSKNEQFKAIKSITSFVIPSHLINSSSFKSSKFLFENNEIHSSGDISFANFNFNTFKLCRYCKFEISVTFELRSKFKCCNKAQFLEMVSRTLLVIPEQRVNFKSNKSLKFLWSNRSIQSLGVTIATCSNFNTFKLCKFEILATPETKWKLHFHTGRVCTRKVPIIAMCRNG